MARGSIEHAPERGQQAEGLLSRSGQGLTQGFSLRNRRHPAAPHQAADVLKRRLGHEALDVVAPDHEPSRLAVDVAQRRLRNDDVVEAAGGSEHPRRRHGSGTHEIVPSSAT